MTNEIDIEEIKKNNRRSVAKAISLVESSLPSDETIARDFLEKLLPFSGRSVRIGITGVPGVGKSTFIENFGCYLLEKGHKVAVLAVDPSSPISGGSILGDKTRMEKLVQSENAFVRPSPSRGALGGVTSSTTESIIILEAAGYDFILVETVGVGQSEFEVSDMVDFLLVLMLPNAGDELQGIKKGILELADLILINKADGEFANKAKQSMIIYQSAMDLFQHKTYWQTKIQTCSTISKSNFDYVYTTINEFFEITKKNGVFDLTRQKQKIKWFNRIVTTLFEQYVMRNKNLSKEREKYTQLIESGQVLPLHAAQEYFERILLNIHEK